VGRGAWDETGHLFVLVNDVRGNDDVKPGGIRGQQGGRVRFVPPVQLPRVDAVSAAGGGQVVAKQLHGVGVAVRGDDGGSDGHLVQQNGHHPQPAAKLHDGAVLEPFRVAEDEVAQMFRGAPDGQPGAGQRLSQRPLDAFQLKADAPQASVRTHFVVALVLVCHGEDLVAIFDVKMVADSRNEVPRVALGVLIGTRSVHSDPLCKCKRTQGRGGLGGQRQVGHFLCCDASKKKSSGLSQKTLVGIGLFNCIRVDPTKFIHYKV
jgi:hypothetical protein